MAATRTPTQRRARRRRRLRIAGVVLLGVLLLDKVVGLARDDAQVGRWDSVTGELAYVAAYDKVWADLPAPTSTRDVRTSYGVVRVYGWHRPEVAGRVPVLLLPGRSSGSPMWAENLPGLIEGRPVYAMDPLGDAGRSVQSTPLRSFVDIAQWVSEALRGLDIDRAHVVGHSFGGASAAALAVSHPDDIASLTLLEPAMTFRHFPLSVFVWAAVLQLPTPQSWRDKALAEIGGTTVDEVRKRTPMSDMIDLGSRHYRAELPMPSVLTDDEIRAWTFPVYVGIAADSSLAGGADAAARVSALLPTDATHAVKVWPHTTHSLPMQVSGELNRELLAFWARADAPR